MRAGKLVAVGLASAASLAMAGQDAAPLQRVLVPNAVETYKSTSKVNQTLQSPIGEIPIQVETDSTYTLKTGKVDSGAGTATVEFTSTVDNVDGGDSPLTASLSKKKFAPIVQDGTMDLFGRLNLNPPTNADKMIQIFSGITGGLQASMFVQLPNKPVKVGDTWDITVPKSPFTGDADQKVTAKVTGDQKVDGKDAWTVDLTGTVNISFDSATLGPADPNATSTLDKTHIIAKGTTTIKGTGLVEKATGKTLSLEANSDLKTAVELPDEGGLTAQGQGTLVTTLKLQPTP